ncbi:MAG: tRNA dihydrouridine synthase DusB [Planctomycetaceae bacterium]|nr:tRNA dihydrouridine synthase DusB [Planctomycetaceae bacterium]
MRTAAELPVPPKLPPIAYGPLKLPSRWLLSPLAGFTNLPFRRIIREIGGVGLATTDLVNARGLLENSTKTQELIATCPEDQPLAVQIFGSDVDLMARAAQFLEARGVASIDINMGCPVNKVTKTGSGASMMCRTDETVSLVERVVRSVRIPVSVKMRLGWDDQRITAPRFARAFEQVGVAAVAIHGRTRQQGFSGLVNRDGIKAVVDAVRSIPVIGNGDVRTVADAERMLRETGCHGVSIGRGALANPWIFKQLVKWEATGSCDPTGSFDDKLTLLRRQFTYAIELRGPERAVPFFRKMAHWYLKSMHVAPTLRNAFQQAHTVAAVEQTLDEIAARGPTVGSRFEQLDEMHIPVPSGPVEHW